MELVNLYKNAPEKADISLTIDFKKRTPPARKDAAAVASSVSLPLVVKRSFSRISLDYSSQQQKKSKKHQEQYQQLPAPPPRSTPVTTSVTTISDRSLSTKSEEDESRLDWDSPLQGMVLPNRDYLTFQEIELEARKIVAAAKRKAIPLDTELARRRVPKPCGPNETLSSLRRRIEVLVTPVRSPEGGAKASCSQSSCYDMYYPVEKKIVGGGEGGNRKKRNRDDSISEDLKLCNSMGDTADSFDLDSISLRTDDIFQ